MHTAVGDISLGPVTFQVSIPELDEQQRSDLVLRITDSVAGVKYVTLITTELTVSVMDYRLAQIREMQREVLHQVTSFLNSLPAPTR